MLIAIDGLSASGKGTIAKFYAKTLGLPYLDTGLLYRASALYMLKNGVDLHDEEAMAELAFDFEDLDDPELRSDQVGEAASIISVYPSVRAALLSYQKDFANQRGGAILDGRDIGTVIAPHADFKLFVVCDIAQRAQRRYNQLTSMGLAADYDEIYKGLEIRDQRDSSRSNAPMARAKDAYCIDTTNMTVETNIAVADALFKGFCTWDQHRRSETK